MKSNFEFLKEYWPALSRRRRKRSKMMTISIVSEATDL